MSAGIATGHVDLHFIQKPLRTLLEVQIWNFYVTLRKVRSANYAVRSSKVKAQEEESQGDYHLGKFLETCSKKNMSCESNLATQCQQARNLTENGPIQVAKSCQNDRGYKL